jgi:hypothetical protein
LFEGGQSVAVCVLRLACRSYDVSTDWTNWANPNAQSVGSDLMRCRGCVKEKVRSVRASMVVVVVVVVKFGWRSVERVPAEAL